MQPSPFSALFQARAFMRFWVARVAGIMANQMLMVAVGWQMYDLTANAWDLGLVGLFQFVPALVLTLPAGHVADRLHRGRIFAASMGLQALVAAAMVAGVWQGQVSREWILALSVLLGVARAFQMPAQQAITPLLVPNALLAKAVTLSTAGMEFAVITGPALGGLIYVWGPGAVYAVCLVLLTLAAALALTVRYSHVPARHAVSWGSLLAGLGFVWHKKVLLGALSLDLFAVLLGGATALLPMYAKDILHTGPEGLGLLRAAPSVGALAMSLVALAVTGAADSISVVIRLTVMQLETPDELRGRVSAVNSIFIGASNQLGEFESGALAAAVGPVGSVVIGGVGTLLVAISWLKLFPTLAQRDHMERPGSR